MGFSEWGPNEARNLRFLYTYMRARRKGEGNFFCFMSKILEKLRRARRIGAVGSIRVVTTLVLHMQNLNLGMDSFFGLTVGWHLGNSWATLGRLLGDSWVTFGRFLGDSYATLGDSWATHGNLLGNSWATLRRLFGKGETCITINQTLINSLEMPESSQL